MSRVTCEHFVPLELECYECERQAEERWLSRIFGLAVGSIALAAIVIFIWEIVT